MRKSPIGSRLLSAYAVLFAGLAPLALLITAVSNGISVRLIPTLTLAVLVIYFGVRVLLGHARYVVPFALIVIVHYLGISVGNMLSYDSYPTDSRAYQMAIPRILRGILFAGVYCWYYLLRKKTRDAFRKPA